MTSRTRCACLERLAVAVIPFDHDVPAATICPAIVREISRSTSNNKYICVLVDVEFWVNFGSLNRRLPPSAGQGPSGFIQAGV